LTENVFINSNLEKAFGGVLRRFTLGGSDLHDDSDTREVTILTDDERPFVQYGEPKISVRKKNKTND
jgi:manganese/iron transport system ATP-binding protein